VRKWSLPIVGGKLRAVAPLVCSTSLGSGASAALGEAVGSVVCQLVDGVVEPLQPFRISGSGDEVAKNSARLPARQSSLHGPQAERCGDEHELVVVDPANAGCVRGAYRPLQLTRVIARCLRHPGRGTVP
jgi:hypothetical protein